MITTIKQFKFPFLIISVCIILIYLIQLINNFKEQKNKSENFKCNQCDSLASNNELMIQYTPVKKSKNITYIQKKGNIIKKGNLIFRGIDSYYFITKINLKDTIEVFDGNKKYLIFDFKRKYVEPQYNMGSDKTNYYYALEHPCENYGFTAWANNKSKLILNKDSYSVFTFKEKDFY